MLYSKNGSIPEDHMSGDKEGWVEVPEPPIAPEGKEVVWWWPPGWVVRDPQPADTETTTWSWSQSEERWVEYEVKTIDESGTVVTTPEIDLGAPSAQPV